MTGKYIQFAGYQLYTKEVLFSINNTDKPTLVFLHDSWGCVDMWGDFPQKISALCGLNALLYDRRGYGHSSPFDITQRTESYLHHEATELIQLMDTLTIKDVVIYGHSDGATIALIAAANYPNRVKGLMVEGPHSFIEESGKAAVLATRERAKTSSLLRSLEKYHGEKTHELFRLWHETWLSDYFAHWTIVPVLHNINCPVIAFQGEFDEFGTVEQLKVIKAQIKTSVTVKEIPSASHTPRNEAENVTLELLKDWLLNNKFD